MIWIHIWDPDPADHVEPGVPDGALHLSRLHRRRLRPALVLTPPHETHLGRHIVQGIQLICRLFNEIFLLLRDFVRLRFLLCIHETKLVRFTYSLMV